MRYATVENVELGFRPLTLDETDVCEALLDEASIIIDAYNTNAKVDVKNLVSCRMVRRAIGSGTDALPIGVTQGTVSALGYSQTLTMGGSSGELYLSKMEKKLLGVGSKIGSRSPIEDL